MITLHDVEQGTPEWHALREGLYTGEGAHKLLKYGKIDYALSHVNNFKGNFWTKRGHLLEKEAMGLYQRINNLNILSVGFVTNDKYPECGYSPDGLLPSILLEVKCFDKDEHMKLINAKTIDDIPFKILAQIYFGLLITELPLAQLIAYNPKMKDVKDRFKIIEIPAKRAVINNFKRILKG